MILPVHNGGTDLDRCLEALAASAYPAFEIIVVDDASTDGLTGPVALRHGAKLIVLDEQSGPAAARNRGAREALGDILFFTDADVVLYPDALALAAKALASNRQISAVFGSYDDCPGHRSFLSQYRNLFHHWVHQTGNPEAFTFWSGCGAIRRDIFQDMNGFDERYRRPSIEDIELGSRLRQSGHRILLDKTILGKHLKHWTLWNLLKTDLFHRGIPWMRLVLHSRRAPSDLNLNKRARAATIFAGLLGASLLLLPLAGHLDAVLPAMAFILAATLSTVVARPVSCSSWGSWPAALLCLGGPLLAFLMAPDPWAVIPLLLIAAVVAAQLDFYHYVLRRRSLAFTLSAVPMQVLYFLSCAAAIPLGLLGHVFDRRTA